jgi:hypothetical protein
LGVLGPLLLHARRIAAPDTSFFTVQEIPLTGPLDTDGDGINETYREPTVENFGRLVRVIRLYF